MSTERSPQRAELSGGVPARRHPLRRASDSSLLFGESRPLLVGAAGAAVVGSLMALATSATLAPFSFTLSSVVAIGLLGAARRIDTATRPDYRPDRTPRSLRVMAAIVALSVFGTWLSAWTIAADLVT